MGGFSAKFRVVDDKLKVIFYVCNRITSFGKSKVSFQVGAETCCY